MAEIQEIALGGSVANGVLQLASGVALDTTLRAVTDQAGNASPLFLSTTQVNIGGGTSLGRLVVKGDGTNDVARLENNSGQNIVSVTNAGTLTFGTQSPFVGIGAANGTGSVVINGSTLRLFSNISSTAGYGVNIASVNGSLTYTTGTGGALNLYDNFAAAAGSANFRPLNIAYTINNSGAQTGTATGIFVNATETNLNGMSHNLMDLQVGGTSRFKVDRVGAFSCGNTVTTATAVASTHKVTVVIGGVTYFLLASNV